MGRHARVSMLQRRGGACCARLGLPCVCAHVDPTPRSGMLLTRSTARAPPPLQGLAAFKGAVLMVSHDQHLIESTVDELWAVEDNTITVFHGTFEDYKKRLKS